MGTFSPTRQLSARQLSARQLSANRWCWISSSLEGLRTEDLKSFGFTDQIRRSAVWVVPLKGPASSSLPRTSPCASVHLLSVSSAASFPINEHRYCVPWTILAKHTQEGRGKRFIDQDSPRETEVYERSWIRGKMLHMVWQCPASGHLQVSHTEM